MHLVRSTTFWHGGGPLLIAMPPRRPDRGRQPLRTLWQGLREPSASRLHLARRRVATARPVRTLAALAQHGPRTPGPLPIATNDVLYHAPGAPPPAGRGHLHPRALTIARGRQPAGGQCRAPPQGPRGDGAAVPRPSARRSPKPRGSFAACTFRSTNCATSIPTKPCRADAPAADAGAARAGGRGQALPARRPGKGARQLDHELKLIEEASYAPYFLTVETSSASPAYAGHPLPGARLGRQFGRLLLPRHHRGRPERSPTCCSSASSRPSATSRPTSTSISSTSGARR